MFEKNQHLDCLQVRTYTNTAYQVADEVATTVLRRQVAGQSPITMVSKLFTLHVERHHAEDISNKTLITDSGNFSLPPVSEILQKNHTQLTLDTKVCQIQDKL